MAGALDTLVKAGAVSPDYADGLAAGLSKQAGYGIIDDPRTNYWEEIDAYAKAHPERVAGGRFEISPDTAARLIDNSRHWWTGAGRRSSTYLGNRIRRAFRWLPGNNMTAEMYDRELEDSRNKFRRDYVRELMDNGNAINPEVAAAVQDKHYRDARMRMADAVRTLGPARAREAGYAPGYAESFRTRQGNAAIAAGQYKPVYDTGNPNYVPDGTPPPKSMYGGEEMRRLYGTNAGLFARNRRRYF